VSELPIPMEYLPINENWGQGYGFALYRTLIPADSVKITVQGLKDYGVVRLAGHHALSCGLVIHTGVGCECRVT